MNGKSYIMIRFNLAYVSHGSHLFRNYFYYNVVLFGPDELEVLRFLNYHAFGRHVRETRIVVDYSRKRVHQTKITQWRPKRFDCALAACSCK